MSLERRKRDLAKFFEFEVAGVNEEFELVEVVEVFLVEDIESSDVLEEFKFRIGESGRDFIDLSGDFLEGVE